MGTQIMWRPKMITGHEPHLRTFLIQTATQLEDTMDILPGTVSKDRSMTTCSRVVSEVCAFRRESKLITLVNLYLAGFQSSEEPCTLITICGGRQFHVTMLSLYYLFTSETGAGKSSVLNAVLRGIRDLFSCLLMILLTTSVPNRQHSSNQWHALYGCYNRDLLPRGENNQRESIFSLRCAVEARDRFRLTKRHQ
jgi:hypothetical protein